MHLRYLNPLPKNLGEMLRPYKKVIVPELNNGQLLQIIRSTYLVDATGINRIKGQPFLASEIVEKVTELITQSTTEN